MTHRIRAAIHGLGACDAMSWPAWWHRMSQLPPRRAVRLCEAWQHGHDVHTTSVPTPYLQSSAPSSVDAFGPTDDTEWLVVALRNHLGQSLDGCLVSDSRSVWLDLAERRQADEAAIRGRIGTAVALDNLMAGLRPPASGNDNPHYFDDIACVRGIAAGLLRPAAPEEAGWLAEGDAVVTHALDGVWGARATAALMSQLVGGATRSSAIDAALHQLPAGSWCAHVVAECLEASHSGCSQLDLAARLERRIVDHVYAYSNQAPETLGLLLAHLTVARDGPSMLLGALAHPRHADALAPLAGAVAGAAFGDLTVESALPVLQGVCVRPLAGVPLEHIVQAVTDSLGERREAHA